VIAAALAKRAHARHRFFELDDRYLAAFLPNLAEMVSMTDGMYLSHGLTEILAVRFLQDADFNVLLRGHCGELAKTNLAWPFHTDARVSALNSKEELISYLLERLNYVVHGTSLTDLFHEDWSALMEGGPRRSITESLADVPLSPPDLCSYLYLEEQHRRFTVPSLEMFRNVLEVRLPFADEAFLEDLFATSAALRAGTDIHRTVMRKELARVRNSNTGAAADAGPLTEAVLDKFNSLFKKLNVYGYRHYHNFDAWMKQQLLASVESVLLDPVTLGRGMLREATLRRLMTETKSGVADHGYLFQVLLIVELWQRENLQ
jgi:asparagine synthase (glutamine-hydrolysing)